MGFRDDIEALCTRARINKENIVVKLPKPPLGWSQHKIDERYFQLEHLIKRNGCKIEKVNITDYRIYATREDEEPKDVPIPSDQVV
jgi:hypothetical protein